MLNNYMNNYQPYTYLIRFKPTGQIYYGSSYANKSKIADLVHKLEKQNVKGWLMIKARSMLV
jgi:hypothetical protein